MNALAVRVATLVLLKAVLARSQDYTSSAIYLGSESVITGPTPTSPDSFTAAAASSTVTQLSLCETSVYSGPADSTATTPTPPPSPPENLLTTSDDQQVTVLLPSTTATSSKSSSGGQTTFDYPLGSTVISPPYSSWSTGSYVIYQSAATAHAAVTTDLPKSINLYASLYSPSPTNSYVVPSTTVYIMSSTVVTVSHAIKPLTFVSSEAFQSTSQPFFPSKDTGTAGVDSTIYTELIFAISFVIVAVTLIICITIIVVVYRLKPKTPANVNAFAATNSLRETEEQIYENSSAIRNQKKSGATEGPTCTTPICKCDSIEMKMELASSSEPQEAEYDFINYDACETDTVTKL